MKSIIKLIKLTEKFSDYRSVWKLQQHLKTELIKRRKSTNGNTGKIGYVILTEHNPVLTIGRRAHNLYDGKNYQIPMVKTDRGGLITYHGPGQLVMYPIIDLDQLIDKNTSRKMTTKSYVDQLFDLVIDILQNRYRLKNVSQNCTLNFNKFIDDNDKSSIVQLSGIWCEGKRKISSVGINVNDRITQHGLSLNVTKKSLEGFVGIVPCGINNISKGKTIKHTKDVVRGNFSNEECHFPFNYKNVTYYNCTKIDDMDFWCSLTSDFQIDKKWIYCRQCIFPFYFNNRIYRKCLPNKKLPKEILTDKEKKRPNSLWCPVVKRYNRPDVWVSHVRKQCPDKLKRKLKNKCRRKKLLEKLRMKLKGQIKSGKEKQKMIEKLKADCIVKGVVVREKVRERENVTIIDDLKIVSIETIKTDPLPSEVVNQNTSRFTRKLTHRFAKPLPIADDAEGIYANFRLAQARNQMNTTIEKPVTTSSKIVSVTSTTKTTTMSRKTNEDIDASTIRKTKKMNESLKLITNMIVNAATITSNNDEVNNNSSHDPEMVAEMLQEIGASKNGEAIMNESLIVMRMNEIDEMSITKCFNNNKEYENDGKEFDLSLCKKNCLCMETGQIKCQTLIQCDDKELLRCSNVKHVDDQCCPLCFDPII
ncbi:hypothetical protein SNEBB_004538 [Seison nebaliae]|nr:hypothetical protein SNEBB_004538 [Seison nebaliae]